jgi:hypothetical protein
MGPVSDWRTRVGGAHDGTHGVVGSIWTRPVVSPGDLDAYETEPAPQAVSPGKLPDDLTDGVVQSVMVLNELSLTLPESQWTRSAARLYLDALFRSVAGRRAGRDLHAASARKG